MPFAPPDQSGLRGNQPPVLRKKPGSGSARAHVPAQPELCGAAAPQAGPKGTPCAPAPVYISKSRKQRACFPFSSVHFSKKARKQITLIVLPLYRQETTALSLSENRPCGSTAYPSLRTYICGSSLAVICFSFLSFFLPTYTGGEYFSVYNSGKYGYNQTENIRSRQMYPPKSGCIRINRTTCCIQRGTHPWNTPIPL